MSGAILPGSTLGVLGSGQLGRMFAIAARRLGYRVHVLSPDDDTPTGQVADVEFRADYLDLDAIASFARGVSVVTFEFENVPSVVTEVAERYAPVRPAGAVLHTTQHRLREKSFLRDNGFPVPPFAAAFSREELHAAAQLIGVPAVLKTASWGYDGKGQAKILSAEGIDAAWTSVFGDATIDTAAILEGFIDFECELSVVAARGCNGEFVSYGPMQNDHANHILDLSICPALISPALQREANDLAFEIMKRLDVTGVLCVEMFLTREGKLLVNELAPRPHNSGHLTIDSHVSCQFEQQVRAACGLPLGSVEQLRPAAMSNLLGDWWSGGEPNWEAALAHRDVKLHLYGKREARPGRKMGHFTALADSPRAAAEKAIAARKALKERS